MCAVSSYFGATTWFLSTDQNNLYRAGGRDLTGGSLTSGTPTYCRMGINTYTFPVRILATAASVPGMFNSWAIHGGSKYQSITSPLRDAVFVQSFGSVCFALTGAVWL
jgi:hypothetical protein